MFDLIAGVLAWLYEITKSYGLAIVGLTILVNVVTTPFTLKSTKSMLEMQRLQPELKRIQTEFKGDRPRMNEEMMAFYKEHQINPLGGCVPMLIQLPVFMVLYQVLSGLTKRFTSVGIAAGQVMSEAVTGSEFAVEFERRDFNPQYVDHGDTIFRDLTATNEMNSFGIDLSRSLSQMLQEGFTDALPYLALILLVFGTSLFQQRQIQGRSSNAQMNPQQQAIMKIIPFMIPIISYGLPAAMVVYFLTGNVFRIAQQAYITRRFYHDRPAPIEASPTGTARAGAPVAAAAKSGGSQAGSAGSRRTGGRAPSSKPSSGTSTNGSSAAVQGSPSSSTAKNRRTTAGQAPPPGATSSRTSPSTKNKKKRT